jgi:DNA repair exonuclease SbcCD nuclease subunit
MRCLATGDWHIRATNPQYRIDNYYETLLSKLHWIFDLAKKEDCSAILQPGDFFDHPDQANRVEIDLISLLRNAVCSVYTIFGQHDLRYRDRSNTALEKFAQDNLVRLVAEKETYAFDVDGGDRVEIYGASWDEEIPTVKYPEAENILLIHRMITKNGPLWFDQKEYITADEMLRKCEDFDLIVSGDNHHSFISGHKYGAALINCGSLMRTTVAQRDHQPIVYIIDTETAEITPHPIPIRPIEEVMNLELADDLKERNEALEAFMNGLTVNYDIELSFEENLKNLMSENKTENHIIELATKFVGKYYEG